MLKKFEVCRLAMQQQRILELWKPEKYGALLTQVMLQLDGEVEPNLLKSTLDEMVVWNKRIWAESISDTDFLRWVQVTKIIQYFILREQELDWHSYSNDQQEKYLNHLFVEFSEQALDYGETGMLQAQIVKLLPEKYVLIMTMPTMWISNEMQVFIEELSQTYARLAGHAMSHEEIIPHIVSKEGFPDLDARENGQNYWKSRDFNTSLKTHLPFANTSKENSNISLRSLTWEVPLETRLKMDSLAKVEKTELSIVLMAAWQTLLAMLTREPLVIGTFFNEGSSEKVQHDISRQGRYLPLEVRIEREESFRSIVRMLKNTVQECSKWLDSFSWEDLKTDTDVAYFPFGYDFSELQKRHITGELTLTVLRQRICADLFDIRLSGSKQADGGLLVELHYNANILKDDETERLRGYFEQLLVHLLGKTDSPIGYATLISQKEQRQLLFDWNETNVTFSNEQVLHRLFEIQVAKTPDQVAVLCGERTLTYQQLNNRANGLAFALQAKGVSAGCIVGIACKRSVDMIVGMLAVLKAGGAYLPLDIAYPIDRIAYMLQDSQTKLLLTQQDFASQFADQSVEVMLLDDNLTTYLEEEHKSNLNLQVTGEQPAYVIYTSGSTGQAKGIVMGHAAICNHMQWMQKEFPLTFSDRVLQKTAFSFDASVWEFYAPLIAGAQLVFPAQETPLLDPASLVQEIQNQGITIMQVVPTMLNMLLEQADFENCTTLCRVFVGGEQLTRNLQEKLQNLLPNVVLINLYGPSECCIDSTYWVAERGSNGHVVPIGRAIANVKLYVLDEFLSPVPQGIAGELYIGGACLALGYLNRPELTAERFLDHPFAKGEKIYKSGDLVRMLPNGALEFLARMDDQIKLRGLRIELGEIEAALQLHEDILQAVVLLREDKPGHPLLVAYVVCYRGEHPETPELRQFLSDKLPEYMVPSYYVYLNELPLMPNGKVDRRQFPKPDVNEQTQGGNYIAPRNRTELAMTKIWSDVLGISEVGIQHDFFDLGGDSLAALKILALCKREGIYLTPTDVFKLRRIDVIAEAVETRKSNRDQKKNIELPIGGLS